MLTHQELLAIIEEGLENGRIAPHMAAYIAAEVLGVEAHETEYYEWYRRPTDTVPLTAVATA